MHQYKLIYTTKSPLLEEMGFTSKHVIMIAGPCAIENKEGLNKCAEFLTKMGVTFLRAGTFKPRTNPYDFQGLGYDGLKMLNDIRKKFQLKVISEILDHTDLDHFVNNVDIIQVGARNMQNFTLLKALGKTKMPILLKRGFSNTIDEWLGAAEYLLSEGNPNIILCERGIRTFETTLRNTLDLGAVIWLKQHIQLPVIIDPSHACGISSIVPKLSFAGIAAGCDGVMVEIHEQPKNALSDSTQALSFEAYQNMYLKAKTITNAIDKILR